MTGRCQTCGEPLDGDSFFWCKKHYRITTVRLRISQAVLGRMNQVGAFREKLKELTGKR